MLTLTSSLSLASGSTYLVDIGPGPATVNGSTFGVSDRLAITGAVSRSGATRRINSGTLDGTDTYLIATYGSEVNGSTFSFTGASGYVLDDTGSALELVPINAVPEPSTMAGGLLVLGALGWRLRRRVNSRA